MMTNLGKSRRVFAAVRPALLCLAMLAVGSSTAYGDFITYDFTTSNGGWTVDGTPQWTWTSGTGWATDGSDGPAINYLISPVFTLTSSGQVNGTFTHSFNFENTMDGGFIEYRVNSGAWNYINSPLVGLDSSQGYNGSIKHPHFPYPGPFLPAFSNQLGPVTTKFALGPSTSAQNFSAGDGIQIRFVGMWDDGTFEANPNWLITSASLNSVQAVPEPGTMILTGLALAGMGGAAWRRRKNKTTPVETPEATV